MDRCGGGKSTGLKQIICTGKEKILILDASPVLTLIAHSV